MLKYLFEPLMEYPLTFWMVTAAVLFECGNLIFRQDLFRLIPLPIRLLIVLAFTAAIAPMAVEAFEALLRHETMPKTVEGVQRWPAVGLLAWVSFLSVALAFLVFQLWEPWKEELLANVSSKTVNYLVTCVLAGVIYSCGLATFLFIYSYQREIPILSASHVVLIGFGQFGIGLSFALWLRTAWGINRFLADVLGLALAGTLGFWFADYFEYSQPDWIFWLWVSSTCFWGLWGSSRIIHDLIRGRRRAEGEILPVEEEGTPPTGHVCPNCDREFVTFRGLRIHRGRMHKETAKA